MKLANVNSTEDFVLYKLAHGYDFARSEHAYIGYYWLWKAGLVEFTGRAYGGRDWESIWVLLHVAIDSEFGEHTTIIDFPLDSPYTEEVVVAAEEYHAQARRYA
jgi:hypothetical protein